MVKSYSFSQNTFFLTTAYIFEKALVFFYFIFLARYLGPENFGIYNFALSFITPFIVLVDLGFSTVLVREVAKSPNEAKGYLENALTFKICASAITLLVVIVVSRLVSHQVVTQQLIYLFFIWIIFESLASTIFASFRGMHNLRYESIGLIINKVFYVFLGLAFIFFKLPLEFFALPLVLGGFFYLLYPLIISKKFFFLKLKFNKEITKKFLKISLPIVISTIFITVGNSINIILISYLDSDKAAGIFSAALRIPMALLFLPGAIGAAVFPVFSSLIKENKQRLAWMFERVLFYMIILSLPIVAGGLILGDQIIKIVYGAEFLEAALSFKIIIAISLFLFLDFVFSSLLTALDKQKENALSRGLGVVINIILCLILIPLLGQLGGAIAFSIGFMVFSSIQLFLILNILSIDFPKIFKKGFLVLFSSLIMSFVLIVLKNQIYFLFLLILGAISYGLTLYLIGGIKKEDLMEMKNIIRSSLKKEPVKAIEDNLNDVEKL